MEYGGVRNLRELNWNEFRVLDAWRIMPYLYMHRLHSVQLIGEFVRRCSPSEVAGLNAQLSRLKIAEDIVWIEVQAHYIQLDEEKITADQMKNPNIHEWNRYMKEIKPRLEFRRSMYLDGKVRVAIPITKLVDISIQKRVTLQGNLYFRDLNVGVNDTVYLYMYNLRYQSPTFEVKGVWVASKNATDELLDYFLFKKNVKEVLLFKTYVNNKRDLYISGMQKPPMVDHNYMSIDSRIISCKLDDKAKATILKKQNREKPTLISKENISVGTDSITNLMMGVQTQTLETINTKELKSYEKLNNLKAIEYYISQKQQLNKYKNKVNIYQDLGYIIIEQLIETGKELKYILKVIFGEDKTIELLNSGKQEIIQAMQENIADVIDIKLSRDLGLSTILKHPQYNLLEIIRDNPYLLLYVTDITIEDVDRIYSIMYGKEDLDSYWNNERLKSLVYYYTVGRGTKEINSYGEVFYSYDLIKKSVQKKFFKSDLTDIEISTYAMTLNGYIDFKERKDYTYIKETVDEIMQKMCYIQTIQGKEYVIGIQLLELERELNKEVKRLMSNRNTLITEVDSISALTRIQGVEMTVEQKNSYKLLNQGVSALIGGAGKGKTQTLAYLVDILESKNNIEYVLLATTNKASARVTECTKKKCKTVHSYLNISDDSAIDMWSYESLISKKREDKEVNSKEKVIIVDEASMLSNALILMLLKTMKGNERLLLVGDIKQLPAISTGKPLMDLIQYIPTVELTVSFRSKYSIISDNANNYVETNKPLLTDGHYSIQNVPENRLQVALENVLYDLNNRGYYLKDTQIITPVAKSKYTWGTKAINSYIQSYMNQNGLNQRKVLVGKGAETYNLCVNDKVIQTKNVTKIGYQKEHTVYKSIGKIHINNGDIGYIEDITRNIDVRSEFIEVVTKEKVNMAYHIIVKYESIEQGEYYVFYSIPNAIERGLDLCITYSDLDLAYALTVHKMQGTQAKNIIFLIYPIAKDYFINRNMVYTALTRAEENVYVLGDIQELYRARARNILEKRLSVYDVL